MSCYSLHLGRISSNFDADAPCGIPNATYPHVQCCVKGDYCMSNGICHYSKNNSVNGYYTADCTDPTLQDPACMNRCGNFPSKRFTVSTMLNPYRQSTWINHRLWWRYRALGLLHIYQWWKGRLLKPFCWEIPCSSTQQTGYNSISARNRHTAICDSDWCCVSTGCEFYRQSDRSRCCGWYWGRGWCWCIFACNGLCILLYSTEEVIAT